MKYFIQTANVSHLWRKSFSAIFLPNDALRAAVYSIAVGHISGRLALAGVLITALTFHHSEQRFLHSNITTAPLAPHSNGACSLVKAASIHLLCIQIPVWKTGMP